MCVFSDQASMTAQETYSEDYFDDTHANWFNNPNLELFDAIARACEKAGPNASVLDVGCGRGDLLKYLHGKNPNLRLTGVDLSPNPPTEGIEFIQGDALELEMNRKFDVVVSLAVIEHVTDIQAFVRGLSDLCEPHGTVIIMTLNDRSILYGMARFLDDKVGVSGPFVRLYSRHHLTHFNVTSLKRLLESNGMPVRETLLHDIPLAAVDFDANNPLVRSVFMFGVRMAFALGKQTGRTYLQTLFCENLAPLEAWKRGESHHAMVSEMPQDMVRS